MSREGQTTKAAAAIIDDVVELSCQLTVLKDGGNDIYKRLHNIQCQARSLLNQYPHNTYARETLAMLNGLIDRVGAASGDIDIPNEDLQLILCCMDLAGDAIRNYLIPRVKPMRPADGMDKTAA